MPSPLPGMDPWLESPENFPDLHDSFIIYLREALNAVLPSPYFAGSSRRAWIETTQRPIVPDVHVLAPRSAAWPPREAGGTALAEAEIVDPIVIRMSADMVEETFLEIYTETENRRVVTTVEVLSPKNKRPGEQGREAYLKKQKELLSSQVHLVEIDLLRGGTHSTAVPRALIEARVGSFDYHVSVHRYDQPEDYLIYPWRMGIRLPTVPIPLLPNDAAVMLPLQPILDRCYDTGLYARHIDYRHHVPDPPLTAAQQAWAEPLLAAKLGS